jgi:hypothetical protein
MRAFWILACCIPSVAAADSPTDGLHLEGWYGKIGAETGVAFGDRGTSALLGGVATFVHINDDLEWIGLQTDLLSDGSGARWSFGPEAGRSIYGADFSYYGERVGDDTHHGVQARMKLTVGLASIYVRGTLTMEASALDVGLQLKAPVYVKRPKRLATAVAAR